MANLLYVSIETTGLNPDIHGIRTISISDGVTRAHQDISLYKDYDPELIEKGVFTKDDLSRGIPAADVPALVAYWVGQMNTDIAKPTQLVMWSARFAQPFLEELYRQAKRELHKSFAPEIIDVQNLYGFLLRDVRHQLRNFQFNTICKILGLSPAYTPEDKLNNLISLIKEIPQECTLN